MEAEVVKTHHVRGELCTTRARYREGRDLKAVKVYTVNQESVYLLVQGVPSVGATPELLQQFSQYGPIEEHRQLVDYPAERFTQVYWIKFQKLASARIAKRKMDDQSFYGGVLHVCYAPEYESVADTRAKLADRRKTIAIRVRKLEQTTETTFVSQASSQEWAYRGASEQAPHRPKPTVIHHQPSAQSHPHVPGRNNVPQDRLSEGSQPRPNLQTGTNAHSFPHPATNPAAPDSTRPYPPLPPGHPPPPTSRYSEYLGSSLDPAPTPNTKIVRLQGEELIVKENTKTKPNPPRFLPRQLQTSKRQLPRRHLQPLSGPDHGEGKEQRQGGEEGGGGGPLRGEGGRLGGEAEGRKLAKGEGQGQQKAKDEINAQLRREAFVLRDVEGPSLPQKEEDRRQTFTCSETGNEAYDKTVQDIRKRVREFASLAPPPQLLRKKRKREKEKTTEEIKDVK